MIAENESTRSRRGGAARILTGLLALVIAIALVYGATGYCFHTNPADPSVQQPIGPAMVLFASWPKNAKPDAVIILSGQTFGYVQPCGCSRPQKGGLERRANFIDSLRKKGWSVAGVDLGDVYPDRHPIGPPPITAPVEESLLKYKTTMNALRDMGYIAVGAGKTEFAAGLGKITAEYALQKEQPPYTLAGNVVGLSEGKVVPREKFFPAAPGAQRPLVGLVEIAAFANVSVGIVGVVGKGLDAEAAKLDSSIKVEGAQAALAEAVRQLAAAPKPPAANVLLYQGSIELARLVAKDRSEFNVILCLSEDSEPPQFPEYVTHPSGAKTMIVQVGHKGRYVGTIGVFKTAGGGAELKYQLVPLGEEYITPMDAASEKANKVLPLLEQFAVEVKRDRFLEAIGQVPHPAQIQSPKSNLSYIGSEKCLSCHGGEHKKWSESKHGHAMNALETLAKRPGLRNLDPECVVCHSIGFGFKTGYVNPDKTPNLKHVGCESCHGPGSGHAAAPKDETLLKYQSPWKQAKTDRLPDLALMAKLADPAERSKVSLPAAQQRVANVVNAMCMKCHDNENDPHFDLYTYWPKIVHSGLGKK
ncbi:MAG TPA: multiheme c-type cytochrome [Gemmataceae bacterium]|jgi:hypothetical protein